jgi:hypothetical protein
LTTTTLVAAVPPTATVAPVIKFVPVIVMGSGPRLPDVGLIPVTVGIVMGRISIPTAFHAPLALSPQVAVSELPDDAI